MGVSWETGFNRQMSRECNKWPELGRPCCWEGKTERDEKLSWEPKRTESKLCTAELVRRGDLVMVVTPLWKRRGRYHLLRAEWSGRWMWGWSPRLVLQEWRNRQWPKSARHSRSGYTGKTGDYQSSQALLGPRQNKLRILKRLKWWPEIWCENCRGLGACETRLALLFWRRCLSGAMICERSTLLSE